MAGKKSRKMTAREKQLAAEVRAEMREKGLLPAKKKPLDRTKFIAEAKTIFLENNQYEFALYVNWALAEMMGHKSKPRFTPSLEAVGAAKVIHLAKRRMDFEAEQRAQGRTEWTVGEMAAAVMDIYEA